MKKNEYLKVVFLNYSQNTVNKGGFAKTTCLMHTNAAEFISKLMAIIGVKNLFHGRTVDYANVVPKILLYKITDASGGKPEAASASETSTGKKNGGDESALNTAWLHWLLGGLSHLADERVSVLIAADASPI